mmetsp:Transcript_65777/g.183481  ORF Transcript_65777/g.183481 Transcript_65777/m.183481 type:complete len:335 (+) Transcript_65777:291-1295(+)
MAALLGGLEDAEEVLRALLHRRQVELALPRDRGRPRGLLHELVAQQGGCRHQVGGLVPDHLEVHQAELQKVMQQMAVRRVFGALVEALEALQEVRWRGDADGKLQVGEDEHLHLQDVLLGVRVGRDVDEVADVWRVNLLELRGDQHRGDADELQPLSHCLPLVEGAIYQVDGEEERLPLQFVLHADLYQPVHQNGPHLGVEVGLPVHVVAPRQAVPLVPLEHPVDVVRVLRHILRVAGTVLVIVLLHLVERGRRGRARRARGALRGARRGLRGPGLHALVGPSGERLAGEGGACAEQRVLSIVAGVCDVSQRPRTAGTTSTCHLQNPIICRNPH